MAQRFTNFIVFSGASVCSDASSGDSTVEPREIPIKKVLLKAVNKGCKGKTQVIFSEKLCSLKKSPAVM